MVLYCDRHRLMVGAPSLLIPLHQHPINNCNPPLWKLRQQFLNHDLQSRIVIPALLQKVKTRILPRIRRNFEFLNTFSPHI
ncbi:hypothetical protein [Nostoc sp. C110]|uniref:hypothetical protein n=1 Tax=Nostoc sp. C110 TaxID=3349876 RepID=UPI00370D8EF0